VASYGAKLPSLFMGDFHMTELNKSGLLRAAIKDRAKHEELGPNAGGATDFARDGRVLAIHTPPDPLVRVHEMMHTKHTIPDVRFGTHPNVQQIIEDCRLHLDHWPWRDGNTPEIISNAALAQLALEQDTIAKSIAADAKMTTEKRGEAFGCAMRDMVAKRAIDGKRVWPAWLSGTEKLIARQMWDAMSLGDYDKAAALYEKTFFGPPPKEAEEESGSGKGDESEDGESDSMTDSEEGDDESEAEKKRKAREAKAKAKAAKKAKDDIKREKGGSTRSRAPKATVCTLDDKGPFTDPCGDPNEGWALATTGSRIYRPALRRPVLPQRIFMKRRPVQPGGAIIIDASGSMRLGADDIIAIIDNAPMATVALYSGNDNEYAPVGTIFVVSKDGFRRDRDSVVAYVNGRMHGNSIDLEAIEWLLQQGGPRTMVTDKVFCGSQYNSIAYAKLGEAERVGDITTVLQGRTLLPPDHKHYIKPDSKEAKVA
jgi:hypothetical protein